MPSQLVRAYWVQVTEGEGSNDAKMKGHSVLELVCGQHADRPTDQAQEGERRRKQVVDILDFDLENFRFEKQILQTTSKKFANDRVQVEWSRAFWRNRRRLINYELIDQT